MGGEQPLSTFETDIREVRLAQKRLERKLSSSIHTFHASRAGDHLGWDLDDSLQGQPGSISQCVEVVVGGDVIDAGTI